MESIHIAAPPSCAQVLQNRRDRGGSIGRDRLRCWVDDLLSLAGSLGIVGRRH
jgi:hypothetical protein